MRRCLLILAIGGLLPSSQAGADDLAPAQLSAAQKIYTSKCSRCHKFYDPQQYGDQEWSMWMGKMKKKARLSASDYDLLVKFTQGLRKEASSEKERAATASASKAAGH